MNKESRAQGQNFSKRGFSGHNVNQRRNTGRSRRHTRAETNDTSGGNLVKTWTPLKNAVANAPCCPGIYKIGLTHDNWIEVVYIGSSSSDRTLREVVTSVVYGYEGGERLAMMVVNPCTRKKLMVQWITSVYPEELIEDELEEYIATNHKIPEYNTPIDPTKGLYVVVDCHVPSDPNDVTIPGSTQGTGGAATSASIGRGRQHNTRSEQPSDTCPHCNEKIMRFAFSNVRIY
ncbi:uncharacterized protein LOC134843624 isoform X2 [Symsagittifera roscoffensis]|uniref:uncharacterized protein LOC134843624 isoform X2 n=1 Tax=Symsagittifera roscoffensis TaxID=84072 RepID=UPI00307B3811